MTHFDTDRLSAWPDLKILLVGSAGALVFIEGGCRLRDFLQARAFPRLEADIRMTVFDHIQNHSPNTSKNIFRGAWRIKLEIWS